MKQQTLAMPAGQGEEFERFGRRTRREEFLDAKEAIALWVGFCTVIACQCPRANTWARPDLSANHPANHLLQRWCTLAENAVLQLPHDIADLHDQPPVLDPMHGDEYRDMVNRVYASEKALTGDKAPKTQDFANQGTRKAG